MPNHGVGDLVADPVDRVERKSGLLEDYRNGAGKIRTPTREVLRLAAIMRHASLFCALGMRTRLVDPSVWIGVRQLAMQRVWG